MQKRKTKKMKPQSKKRPPARVSSSNLLTKFQLRPALIALLVLSVVILGFILIRSQAATVATITNPPNSSSTCGATVANYTYQVPFGKNPLNIPVCNIPKHPRSADFVSRWYNYSNYNDGSAGALANRGKIGVGIGNEPPATNWSRNIYSIKESNIQRQVMVCPSDCRFTNLDGATYDKLTGYPQTPIPWNNSWVIAQAGDNEVIIKDEDTGRMWTMSGVRNDPLSSVLYCGPFVGDRLCGTVFTIMRDSKGNIADYRSFEGSDGDRGLGLPMLNGMVLPEEVQAGEIRHAMTVATFNTSFGPECTTAQRGTAAENVTCGTAIAPAAKFEHVDTRNEIQRCGFGAGTPMEKIYTQDKMIPEGTRLALNIDNAGIEAWIKTRPDLVANPRRAETARIFARAMRDYGIVIADTSCNGTGIQTPGSLNPKTKQQWLTLGFTETEPGNLLDGLANDKNMYAVDTPTNYCLDGTQSKYYCPYSKSIYPTVNYSAVPTSTTTTTVAPPTTTSTITPPPTTTITPAPTTTVVPTTVAPQPTTAAQPCVPSYKESCPVTTPPVTVDTSSPTMPTNVTAQLGWEPTSFRYFIALDWTKSTDNVAVTSYQIKKNNNPYVQVATNRFVDYEITPNAVQSYQIQAKDGAGNLSSVASKSATMRCFLVFCWVE